MYLNLLNVSIIHTKNVNVALFGDGEVMEAQCHT